MHHLELSTVELDLAIVLELNCTALTVLTVRYSGKCYVCMGRYQARTQGVPL